jgi:hypothetical protein
MFVLMKYLFFFKNKENEGNLLKPYSKYIEIEKVLKL